ncbi:hypothetical protein COLO4_01970 [Corchorus olitorius]|uniref:Uncharacterized protein n=1 Tax=Corchorus olitorius TaxID=93759 RepID=A0A1R3L1X1_9ROSI|nr:hypothetical protein COLO4_01970 [Corchorus olitorius]
MASAIFLMESEAQPSVLAKEKAASKILVH